MFHDEAAFLRALRADPWSEAQRLIYADWLEEQGCAEQAEHLRLEHALGIMDAAAPERFRAEARFKALRKELPATWLQAVQMPYALVLEAPLPSGRGAASILGSAMWLNHHEVRSLTLETPCVLAENLSRKDAEERLSILYGDRRVARSFPAGEPRVTLRPMASLRYALRLEQATGRRGNKNLKLTQEMTGLGFKKAVALLASAPCVLKYDLNQPDAQKWQARFVAISNQATLRLHLVPPRLTLCKVTLLNFDPRFRAELIEQLQPFYPPVRRSSFAYENWYGYDPLQTVPLVLKKCLWQEEAEEIRERLELTSSGEQLAEVAVETF
jgi:uncharacterized protein (TIGR02996 family)